MILCGVHQKAKKRRVTICRFGRYFLFLVASACARHPAGNVGDDMKITHKDHVSVMSQISKKIKQHTQTLSMRKSRRSGDLIVLINMVHCVWLYFSAYFCVSREQTWTTSRLLWRQWSSRGKIKNSPYSSLVTRSTKECLLIRMCMKKKRERNGVWGGWGGRYQIQGEHVLSWNTQCYTHTHTHTHRNTQDLLPLNWINKNGNFFINQIKNLNSSLPLQFSESKVFPW